jgi:DNA segregation ATPase FtsK/SpoIIIE-like protein
MKPKTDHVLLSFFLVIAFALAGCGEKTSQAPPKQQVQDVVRACLPPFLSLDSIELEPIPTGPEAVKVNFKATVTPKEDLYQVDREVEGTPPVTLLKVVQAAGTEVSLYGSVEADRTMDQWTLESPEIQVGLRQFGEPRGAFDAQSYVTGSSEASAALRQQAANAAELERARKAAREQEERERIARQEQEERERIARQEQEAREAKARQEREEQARIVLEEQRKKEMEQRKKEEEERQKEDEAARQKLILATVPGASYIGTAAGGDNRMRIRLVFTEQKGVLVRAEISYPGGPKEKHTYAGELDFKAVDKYSILMSRAESSSSVLKLRLADTGLEGEGFLMPVVPGFNTTIRLQREGTPLPTPPAADPPGSPSSPRRGPDGIVRPLVPPPLPQPPESPQAPQPEAPRSP